MLKSQSISPSAHRIDEAERNFSRQKMRMGSIGPVFLTSGSLGWAAIVCRQNGGDLWVTVTEYQVAFTESLVAQGCEGGFVASPHSAVDKQQGSGFVERIPISTMQGMRLVFPSRWYVKG